MRTTFQNGDRTATCMTSRSCKFALIGNFNGEGYRVISLHARRDLARPEDVRNESFSDVCIAERT